ncbi:hypothetical protein SNE40_013658 [Patella caerulea]|uniref:Secreted protein n=1 Tax=Patella caerulea TaxID=87958 RepID=A0AAN8PP23_PATCE
MKTTILLLLMLQVTVFSKPTTDLITGKKINQYPSFAKGVGFLIKALCAYHKAVGTKPIPSYCSYGKVKFNQLRQFKSHRITRF